MATEQQPEGLDPTGPDNLDDELGRAGAARRRFTKAGLGASGVLMTLASQSGMACDICRSPSGHLSGALTSQKVTNLVCQGRSPGYWKNCSYRNWPGNCPRTAVFKEHFYTASGLGYQFRNYTLLQILQGVSGDKNNVAMHLVAAYLNACKGWTSFLLPDQVKNIWREYVLTGGAGVGYYQPAANVRWYGYQIVSYISGTQD